MDFLPKKKHCVYAEVKKNIFISNAQNQSINAESFAFNDKTRLGEYFNPNNNAPMTPKNIYPNHINPQSPVIIKNTNNINNSNNHIIKKIVI